MPRAFLSVLALLAAALVHADGSVTGKYRNREVAGRVGATSELVLRVNGRFLLERNGRALHGDYRVEEDRLTLRTEDGERLRGEIRDGSVVLDGQTFARVSGGGADLTNRRFPTDASTGRLDRARPTTVPADPPRREGFGAPLNETKPPAVATPALVSPLPSIPVEPAPKPVIVLKADDFAGVWTVRRDGLEEKGWRMELKRNGDFKFAMKGLTSEGQWTVVDNEIVLVYKKVDGEDLEEGASGVKRLPCALDASAFQIDTYRYERASGKS